MATTKIFQFGDLHDPRKYSAVRQFMQSRSDINVGVFVGDAFEGKTYAEKYQEALKKEMSGLKNNLSPDEAKLLQIAQMVQANGGIENLEKALIENKDSELNEQISQLVGVYRQNEDKIQVAAQKQNKFVHDNKDKIQAAQKKTLEAVLGMAKKDAQAANKELSQVKQKIVGIPGNHDLVNIYEHLSAIHWLDKKGPIKVGGLSFGGMINCGDKDRIVPSEELYAHFEKDVPYERIEEFLKSNGSASDLKEFYENNAVVKRCKGQSIDCLVTHKGFDGFAGGFGVNAGAKKAFETMKPKLQLCGHIHGAGLYDDTKGYQGLKSTEKYAYVIHVDNDTKEIEKVEVYKWVYKKDKQQGAKPSKPAIKAA
ncbi:hypothetical protein HZA97_04520 [Candidatus Woesearchaeota archaeon]|nr:hypothetical protein [Candidatus Woesearchaeota archaeon]